MGRGGGEHWPASNILRDIRGGNATALVSTGHSTRSTMRQKPPTVASHEMTAGALDAFRTEVPE